MDSVDSKPASALILDTQPSKLIYAFSSYYVTQSMVLYYNNNFSWDIEAGGMSVLSVCCPFIDDTWNLPNHEVNRKKKSELRTENRDVFNYHHFHET
jgi:hypothetical protein